MKKFLIRYCLLYFLAIWVFFLGLTILIAIILGHDINLLEKCITGIIFALCMSLAQVVIAYSVLPRSKYLEKNDGAKPSFKVACSSTIDVPQGFDFDNFKNEIASNWVITFSDDIVYVLKFRKKLYYFGSWGTGAWLKFDEETGKIHIDCFMMMVGADGNPAQKMLKEIEACLNKTTLNFESLNP